MWLEILKRYDLLRDDPRQSVQQWRADFCACNEDGSDQFIVGRLFADQIDKYDALDWGHEPLVAADADSDGLLSVYEYVQEHDADDLFPANLVYIYRFAMHPDFAQWKLAAFEGFCRQFFCETIIVTQPNTIWFSEAEFMQLGFGPITEMLKHRLPAITHPAPALLVRDNTLKVPLEVSDFPTDCPEARVEHEEWLNRELPGNAVFI